MMDQKSWLWRKRSSEKTTIANDEAELSPKRNEEEMLHYEKEIALERSVKNLHDKVASLLCECHAKDNLVADHAKAAQEAIAGREKAEAELAVQKQELQEALQQKLAFSERLVHLRSALKDCRQELSYAREGQDQRVHEAVMKISEELKKEHKILEEKITETSKRLASLTVENSQLTKDLVMKERLIEEASEQMAQATTEFNTLMARLDSTEKEKDILKYEFLMLEKELNIRSEELEFSRRSADEAYKQHLQSSKKVSMLEAECQRLRLIVRKRHPGPIAFPRAEIVPKGRNAVEIRKTRSNHMTGGLIERDGKIENALEVPDKRISFMIKRLCEVEEENKILKESVNKRDYELHSLRASYTRIASELTLVEDQLIDKKCQRSMVLANSEIEPGSWASALMSELDNFKHEEADKNASEHKMIRISDMSLMDDFVEMEKLAIVSADENSISSNAVTNEVNDHPDSTGKELVPVSKQDDSFDMESRETACGKLSNNWLQNVLKEILEQNHASKKSFNELLEDIRLALEYTFHAEVSKPLPISGYITWKSDSNTSSMVESFSDSVNTGRLTEENEGFPLESNNVKALDKDLEAKSLASTDQLTESEESIGGLQDKVGNMKESKRVVEYQIENQKLINEDLDTQLTFAKFQLNEVLQKLSSLEVELEGRSQCCEELEATCLELQLQLASMSDKEAKKEDVNQNGQLLQNGWEFTAASAKLAECQETIFNLGEQLKALAKPKETAVIDKLIATTNSKTLSQHSSLLEHLLAKDQVHMEHLNSPKTKEIISSTETKKSSMLHSDSCNTLCEIKNVAPPGILAIIPSKKRDKHGGLLRKLLFRRKRGSSKKISISYAA